MTQRLYYVDSYLREFEASIVDRSDTGRRIYLDRTAFYPASGGQPCDAGRLNGVEVAEVVDEGETVAHLLVAPLPGGAVRGQLNWPRRFDHMQQHSGQHLLSAVLAELLGHTTVSVHIGQHSSTIDLDASQLTPEQVVQVEERANEVITENRRVEVTFEEAATAIGLRKTPTRSGTLRIVTIADLDRSACGGTHVRATGEIGSILLRKVERARKGVRVEFLCGLRAIRLSRRESEVLGRLSSELSSSIEELPQVLESKQVELKEVTAIKRTLETSLNGYRAKELYSAAVPDATGIRRTLVRQSSGPMDELRGLAQAFASLPQAVFIGAIEAPPSVLLGAAADSGIDAGGVLKGILQAAGGRGGGSAGLAQGVLPGLPQLEQVIASLGGTKK